MKDINKVLLLKICAWFVVISGAVLAPSFAEASAIVFGKTSINVGVGSTFTLPVSVDPSGDKQYTAKLDLLFPADLFEVVSFSFNPSWLPVSQPGYDLLNNTGGELIKTAGFPGGFYSPTLLGTVTFKAKRAGEGYITVGQKAVVLNSKSKDTLASRSQTAVSISATSASGGQGLNPTPDGPNIFDVSQIDASNAPQIQTAGAGLVSRVAPGDFLTFTVKLLNFGNRNKVDVKLLYNVVSVGGAVIYHAEETVAVETTAAFVKTIQIPFGTPSGKYTVKTSITYKDQVTPATTSFTFAVERKIFNLFLSDFTTYGGTTFVLVLLAIFGYILFRRHNQSRFSPFSYASVPSDTRVFYEMLSDTIMGMRRQVGNEALSIASLIDGLEIDKETGQVLAVTKSPSQVIAALVSQYEKLLGRKVSFSFRRDKPIY